MTRPNPTRAHPRSEMSDEELARYLVDQMRRRCARHPATADEDEGEAKSAQEVLYGFRRRTDE